MEHHNNTAQQQTDIISPVGGVSITDEEDDAYLVLPHEIYVLIALFIPDLPSVGRCAAVCKAFYAAIIKSVSYDLWKNLARKHWKIVPLLDTPSTSGTTRSDYMSRFRRRHRLDVAVSNVLTDLATTLMENDVYTKRGLCWSWGNYEMVWKKFRKHFTSAPNDSYSSYEPNETLDALVRIANRVSPPAITTRSNNTHAIHSTSNEYRNVAGSPGIYDDRMSVMRTCFARNVFDSMYFAQIRREWIQLLWTTEGGNNATSHLEHGAILVAKYLLNHDDSTDHDDPLFEHSTQLAERVSQSLDMYAQELRLRLQQHAHNNNSVAIAEMLMTLDLPGKVARDWDIYDISNVSITHVLFTGNKGIPLTLVLICKFILDRVGVASHVIGLPTRNLLGVPDATNGRTVYFDIFHDRRRLTVEDCRSYVPVDIPWDDSYLQPMTTISILTKMLLRVIFCTVGHPTTPRQMTDRQGVQVARCQMLLDFLRVRENNDPRPKLNSIVLALDTDIIFVKNSLKESTRYRRHHRD